MTARLAVVAVLCVTASPSVKFLHPKERYLVAGMRGAEMKVQGWIPPHPDNRRYTLYWDGEGCGGGTGGDLDGDSLAMQPTLPITAKVSAGACGLMLTVYGAGDTVRAQATHLVEVQ